MRFAPEASYPAPPYQNDASEGAGH